jgi:hypothetical protein
VHSPPCMRSALSSKALHSEPGFVFAGSPSGPARVIFRSRSGSIYLHVYTHDLQAISKSLIAVFARRNPCILGLARARRTARARQQAMSLVLVVVRWVSRRVVILVRRGARSQLRMGHLVHLVVLREGGCHRPWGCLREGAAGPVL